MLELRPAGGGGKEAAVGALLGTGEIDAAIYAGDDRTDIDAFQRLHELRGEGRLQACICVGVTSEEAPIELAEAADLSVDGPRRLARRAAGSGRIETRRALHRPAAGHGPARRRRGDRAGRGHRAGGRARRRHRRSLIVAAGWWLFAIVAGLYLGRPARAADGVRGALASARTRDRTAAGEPAAGSRSSGSGRSR